MALEPGRLSLDDLRSALGASSPTTVRKRLQHLAELGVLVKVQQSEFPWAVAYELGPAGLHLLDAAHSLSAWLATSPAGPLAIGGSAAKGATQALIGGWTSNILRALAAKPLSLTELDRLLSGINYPALSRRLDALRLAGQISPVRSRAGGTPYKVSRWLRQAVGPLATAAEWERSWAGDRGEGLRRHDIEAMLLLAIPLLELPPDLDGSCRFAVEVSAGDKVTAVGIAFAVRGGRVVSIRSALDGDADDWVKGPEPAWLNALGGGAPTGLASRRIGEIGDAVLVGLRRALSHREADPVTSPNGDASRRTRQSV
jgi:DNA-binding HxlR family transcriptional regulator